MSILWHRDEVEIQYSRYPAFRSLGNRQLNIMTARYSLHFESNIPFINIMINYEISTKQLNKTAWHLLRIQLQYYNKSVSQTIPHFPSINIMIESRNIDKTAQHNRMAFASNPITMLSRCLRPPHFPFINIMIKSRNIDTPGQLSTLLVAVKGVGWTSLAQLLFMILSS